MVAKYTYIHTAQTAKATMAYNIFFIFFIIQYLRFLIFWGYNRSMTTATIMFLVFASIMIYILITNQDRD